jgi:hypothetical protein
MCHLKELDLDNVTQKSSSFPLSSSVEQNYILYYIYIHENCRQSFCILAKKKYIIHFIQLVSTGYLVLKSGQNNWSEFELILPIISAEVEKYVIPDTTIARLRACLTDPLFFYPLKHE